MDSVTQYLQQFEDLGIKEVNNPALVNTKDWITEKYQNWGYTDIVEDDFNVFGNSTMTNIVVTKTGTLYPDTYVIIDGHYDTRDGPGANDNGSGTVILLELARLIKDIPTEYSIKFIHFSGEEIGLEGSSHYVNNIVIPSDMDIKVVFNIDQVGGLNGTNNTTIICERDQAPPNSNDAQSAVMTDELATCTNLYSNLLTEISFAYGSDYVPFMQNGYVVTGFYEKNVSPYTHSIQDSIQWVDLPYLHQVTKASMGALLHFAVAQEPLSIKEFTNESITVYPNPANSSLHIDWASTTPLTSCILMDMSGKEVEVAMTKNLQSAVIDISPLDPGQYILRITTKDSVFTERIIRK
jgi:Zn-dependent M28 family amino/carboxypeptidase